MSITSPRQFLVAFIFALAVPIALLAGAALASETNFSGFTPGTIHHQGTGSTITTPAGYVIPNPYGSLWTVADEWGFTGNFDEEVQDDGTGNTVWRLSNALTSNSYSNQPNSPSSPEVAGESTANLYNDRGPVHTAPFNPPQPRAAATTSFFHGGFEFKSATGGAQPGLFISVNPIPRQTSFRMSYVGMEDTGTGLNVIFYETLPGGIFKLTTIAEALSYAEWHQVDIYVEFVDGLNGDGSGNDVVTVLVNGALVHTGTTWESYFAENSTLFPSPIAVDALLFRAAGIAALSNTGNGFFFDNVVVDNQALPSVQVKEAKEAVLADLAALFPTGDDKDDKSIEKAIQAINNSLKPEYWADDNHLTDKGKKVFDEEKKAVKELEKVQSVDVSGYIDALVAVDASLAQIAIDEVYCGGDKCEKELAKALEEMGKATEELAQGKPDKAIDRYKKAWEHARKAMNKAVETEAVLSSLTEDA